MAYNKPKFFDFLILYSILLLDRHNCLASDSAVRFGFSFSNSTIFFCVLFSCSSSFVCLRVTTSLDGFWINSEVSSKLFRSFSEVIPKLFRSFSEVIPKLFRSYSEVSPKFLRSFIAILLFIIRRGLSEKIHTKWIERFDKLWCRKFKIFSKRPYSSKVPGTWKDVSVFPFQFPRPGDCSF